MSATRVTTIINDLRKQTQAIAGLLERNSQLLLVVTITAIWCLVFRDYLFFRKAFVFDQFAIDTLSQFYPLDYFRLSNLLAGRLPFWSFQFDLGIDVYSLMINSNPFELVYLLFGPDHFIEVVHLVVLAKFLAAGLFFHAFLDKLDLDPMTALIGALLFTFSGYMLVNCHWYHYSNYAVFIALFLYCFELWLQQGRWLPLVLVLGLVGLKGELQLFQMACFGFIYVCYRGVQLHGWSLRLLRLYAWLALFFGLGLLVGAYVFLPNVLAIVSSSRVESAVNDASTWEQLLKMLQPEQGATLGVFLARFLANDLLGSWVGYRGVLNYFEDSTLYIGLPVALLFPVVLFSGRRNGRLLWIFPLSVLLVVGFPWLRCALNGFASSTFKYLSLYCGFFALFGALQVLDRLFTARADRLTLLLVRLFSGLFLLLFTGLGLFSLFNRELLQSWGRLDQQLLPLTLVLGICWLLLFLGLSRAGQRPWLKWLVLLLVVVEVALFSGLTVGRDPGALTPFFAERGEHYFNPATRAALARIRRQDAGFYRIEKGYNDGHLNDPLVQDYFGTQSYFGFVSSGVVDFYHNLGLSLESPRLASYRYGLEKRSALQSLLGVKYFLCRDQEECADLEGFSLEESVEGVHIYRNTRLEAAGQVLGRMVYQQIGRQAFAGIGQSSRDGLLLEAVVTDQPIPWLPLVDLAAGGAAQPWEKERAPLAWEGLRLESWDGEQFQGRITTHQPGVLLLPIPYDRGWQLSLNEREVAAIRVDFGFIGVPLAAAEQYRVELRYRPPFFITALLVSLCSLLLVLLLWWRCPILEPNRGAR